MIEQDTPSHIDQFLTYFSHHFGVDVPGNLLWSHAVNDQAKLERVLQDSSVMMIESDVRISRDNQVITAHPPAQESDLSLEKLLEKMHGSNKGLKLDFKDPETVVPTLKLLKDLQLKQPVLLNADLLRGNGANPSPFNADELMNTFKQLYPQGYLSLGWTTVPDTQLGYTQQNVGEALELVEGLCWVTFPVRACLLPGSWQILRPLIQKNNYTLTIWNNELVDAELQNWIRQNTDPKKTFYDFIDENKEPLRFL